MSAKYTFIPWERITRRWTFSRIPSRSFPEKRPHEMSRPRRRADAASGASPLSAFEEEALTALGEKSGEEVEIPRRARCWRKPEPSGPMTPRSLVVYWEAMEVGNMSTDDAIAKAE